MNTIINLKNFLIKSISAIWVILLRLLNKLRTVLSIIFGIFSNLSGAKNPLYHKGREITYLKIRKNLFYIVQEDGDTVAITAEKPRIIEIYPLLKCNLACTYCDRGKENSMLEDFNEIKILYDNLKKDKSFHFLKFRISGGEPTIYPKINELILFLRTIDPYAKIDFITNVIELKKITKQNLEYINLMPSIYPYTEEILKNDKYIVNFFESKGLPLKTNVFSHDDMSSYGTIKNNCPPCNLLPILVCGTKCVYPCCRAHRLEQDYGKKYHLEIYSPNLYKNLKSIITDTDLCTHCPRVYSNHKKIFLTSSSKMGKLSKQNQA